MSSEVASAFVLCLAAIGLIGVLISASADHEGQKLNNSQFYECANGKGYNVSYYDNIICVDKSVVLESKK